MISQVRKTLKGAVAWFVIVLLILAFALWGVPELRQFSGTAAVKVGSESFSPQYVQNEFNRAVQMQASQAGGNYTRQDAIQSGLPGQIVDSIATTSALDQFAEKIGLAMPRSLVANYLQSNENFQNPATGKFDELILNSILQRVNISASDFERRVAGEMQRDQLIESLALQSNAPKQFTQYLMLRETERRQISYLIVTDEMAGKSVEPTPDDLRQYYDEHPAAYTSQEYRIFDLLVLKNDDFQEGVDVSEEDIRQVYDQNLERQYSKPERRTLYQITFDTEAEAKAAASALRNGDPFEKLALDRGLTLDAVTNADAQKSEIVDPNVATAAFATGLTDGDVLDPVEGVFGWTVVQIAEITQPEVTSFEDAREEIEEQFLSQDTRRAMLNAIDEIEEERDTGAALPAAAEATGFETEKFGPVDRFSFGPGGEIINNIPGEALAEAFLLEEDQDSEALPLSDNSGFFFVRVEQIQEPALKPFDDVRDEVESAWRKQERQDRIEDTIEELRSQIANGKTLAEVAALFDRTPTTIVIDRRFENEAISSEFNAELFEAAPQGIVSGAAALGEAQVLTQIDQVAINPLGATQQQEEFYGQYLGYQLDQELLDAFLQSVRTEYDTKINQAQLDAIFGDQ